MAIVIINDEYLTEIAEAIRTKNGLTVTYKPSEMAEAITSIPSVSAGGDMTKATVSTGGSLSFVKDTITFDLSEYDDSSKQVFFEIIYQASATYNGSTSTSTSTGLFTINIDRNGNINGFGLAGLLSQMSFDGIDEDDINFSFIDNKLTFEVKASAYEEYEWGAGYLIKPTNISFLNSCNIYYVQ